MKNLISYGQHYLEDNSFYQILMDNADITCEDSVIEIGAGDGRLTIKLAERAKNVISYEIDDQTKDILTQNLERLSNVKVIFKNFLKAEIPNNVNKIVASLPYQITEPFIEKIKGKPLDIIALIVGSTFANSIVSDEFTGKLGLLVKCYFRAQKICDISPKSFSPPPKTWSSIVILKPITKDELVENPPLFIMREIFEQRDKKLKNALREAIIRFYEKRNVFMSKRESERIISNWDCIAKEQGVVLEQMNNTQLESLFAFLLTIN